MVRVDTCLEFSIMNSCAVLPREGHLGMLYRLFTHVKKHHSTEMVFDMSKPSINHSDFESKDWNYSEFSSKIKNKSELHLKLLLIEA